MGLTSEVDRAVYGPVFDDRRRYRTALVQITQLQGSEAALAEAMRSIALMALTESAEEDE